MGFNKHIYLLQIKIIWSLYETKFILIYNTFSFVFFDKTLEIHSRVRKH